MKNIALQQSRIEEVIPKLFWPDDQWTVPALRTCLGRHLTSLAFGEFWCDGHPDMGLDGELEFVFDGGQLFTVTITHMFGVVAASRPLSLETLDDGRMEWKRRELTAESPWCSLIGAEFLAVDVLIKPDIGYGYSAGVAGFVFDFGRGRVGYENWDYDSGRITFNPMDGVWSAGQVINWLRVIS